ncbi:TetR/AcrR family transcriptional regulator [Beijerinckia sp. L45]|uniref:TetR/AcrR family transcriptional regulator n=1 Tax=Beijerinckia sp. L45 TaxID=1641855 RepID=UPI00131A7A35|nr:TetR/AcrR family transcriptional regulator [Beijerinckia sp. L45]
MAESSEKSTKGRREAQRERLIGFAEHLIATQGLDAVRARELAKQMGCAVGAIYNLVTDLDELVLLVAQRTQRDLSAYLDAAAAGDHADAEGLLVAWAETYLRFAKENRLRWRALFEFRLPPDTPLPAWFVKDQEAIFSRLEDRLLPLTARDTVGARKLKARILFAAVHGIVALSLEEKVVAMPIEAVEGELAAFVRAYLRGLTTK